MVYPYVSKISYWLKKKKEEMDAIKQSWEIDILYSFVRKIFNILGLFQTIIANITIEKKYSTMINFLRELFAKTADEHYIQ